MAIPQWRTISNPRARLVAVAVCWALSLALFYPLWFPSRVDRSQWRLTHFDVCGSTPCLVHGAEISEASLSIDVDRNGQLGIGPGSSIALPLPPSAGYRVVSTAEGLAPYLVLAYDQPPSSFPDGRPRLQSLQDAVSIDALGGSPALGRWRSGLAWREDADRLRSIATACERSSDQMDATVRREGDTITVRLGTCSFRQGVSPGRPAMLAVLAGTRPAFVERDGGWKVDRSVWAGGLAVMASAGLVASVLLVSGFGSIFAPLLVSVLLLFARLAATHGAFHPALLVFPTHFLWFAGVGGAALATLWRFGLHLRSKAARRVVRSIPVLALVIAAAAAVALLPSVIRFRFSGPGFSRIMPDPAKCFFAGFSAGAGATLRAQEAGPPPDEDDDYAYGDVRAYLSESCSLCAGSTSRIGMPARIFEEMRDYTTRPEGVGVRPGGNAMFWGATNDDYFWPLLSRHSLRSEVFLLSAVDFIATHQDVSGTQAAWPMTEVVRLLNVLPDVSLGYWGEQQAALTDTVRAVRARGVHFTYFNGFLAWDLDSARTPARQTLLQRRRETVAAAGGTFVDLLPELQKAAGVSWFNDWSHSSTIAHEHVAAAICTALAKGGSN